jgi:hypothetical protein
MQDHYRKFCVVLERELVMTAQIEKAQLLVRDAVRRRDWIDFEAILDSLKGLGVEFEALDLQREKIFENFAALALPVYIHYADHEGESRFYALVSRLTSEERSYLTEMYRNLKIKILKIRFQNESLAHYLSQARVLVKDVLDSAFPDRKGSLYTRHGTALDADMRSMVLNRQL